VALALLLAPAASAWAPAATAPVHPGVQTTTAGSQCTSNFVFSNGSSFFLGQAAHCASTADNTSTNGCTTGSLPVGTPVTIAGASRPGVLAYSSWRTMQAIAERDPDTCAFNDLALVRIDPADVASVNPSVPGFGGPLGMGSLGAAGANVFTFDNSTARAGLRALQANGGSVYAVEGAWSHSVTTYSPGIAGDSGAGFLNASGQAAGVESTLRVLPMPGTNGVGDLTREVNYAWLHGGIGSVSLVNGTQPFRGDLVAAATSG